MFLLAGVCLHISLEAKGQGIEGEQEETGGEENEYGKEIFSFVIHLHEGKGNEQSFSFGKPKLSYTQSSRNPPFINPDPRGVQWRPGSSDYPGGGGNGGGRRGWNSA